MVSDTGDDVLVDVPDDSTPYADAYDWRRIPVRPIRRGLSSRRSTQMINRQCAGLYADPHGPHAWFPINADTGRSFRRGKVVFFCSGTYRPILPQIPETDVRSHRG